MTFYSLASGSGGNSTLIITETKNILIDVGLSMKKIEQGLMISEGFTLEDIDLILITHAHGDHIHSLLTIHNKYPHIKVLMHSSVYADVYEYFEKKRKTVEFKDDSLMLVDGLLSGNVLDIDLFNVKHDKNCYGWTIREHNGESLVFIPDNGMLAYKFKDIPQLQQPFDYYCIESNYDERLQYLDTKRDTLLKRRVLGAYGHSSNIEAISKLIFMLDVSQNTIVKGVMFTHLSKDCNSVELANEIHQAYIEVWGHKRLLKNVKITYALQDEVVKGSV